MTCAQGLLRLLWGEPEVGVLRDWLSKKACSWFTVTILTGQLHFDNTAQQIIFFFLPKIF